MDEATRIATTLIRAIQKIRKENHTFQGRHGKKLQQLATIFSTTAENIAPTLDDTKHTSTTPTAPSQTLEATCTH